MSAVVQIGSGDEIRRLREASGLTQAQLAAQVGTSQQTIDRIERAEVGWSRFISPTLEYLRGDPAPSGAEPLSVAIPSFLGVHIGMTPEGDVYLSQFDPDGEQADTITIPPAYLQTVIDGLQAASRRLRRDGSI